MLKVFIGFEKIKSALSSKLNKINNWFYLYGFRLFFQGFVFCLLDFYAVDFNLELDEGVWLLSLVEENKVR